MRPKAPLPTLFAALLLVAPGSASALQVDIMWWNGSDQFGPDQTVFIHPFAAGDKLDGGSTTNGIDTWELRVSGYSRTWDVTGTPAATLKQADLFISFTVDGVSNYTLSTRYDGGGSNMLNVVALREYNVRVGSDNVGTVDYGLGGVNQCEPNNNCTDRNIISGGAFSGNGTQYLAQESVGGNAGWVYGWSTDAEVPNDGPQTKGRSRVGTVRVGSILFELNAVTGQGIVVAGAFALGDGVTDNGGNADSVTNGGGAVVIPEPRVATLLLATLTALAARRSERAVT